MCGTTWLHRIESFLDSFAWQVLLSTQSWLPASCLQIWDQFITTVFDSCHVPRETRRGEELFFGDVTSSVVKEGMERLVWLGLITFDWLMNWCILALPFTKNPEANPTFRIYFSREWYQTLNTSLRNFFSTIFTYLRILELYEMWCHVILLN